MKILVCLAAVVTAAAPFAIAETPAANFRDNYLQRFNQHRDNYQQRYQRFYQQVKTQWGDQTELSSTKVYILYEENLQTRYRFDFENNNLTIETLSDQAPDPAQVQRKVQEFSTQPMAEAIKQDPLLQDAKPEVLPTESIMTALVPSINQTQLLQQATITQQQRSATISPTQSRAITQTTLSWPEADIYRQRARKFTHDASQQAKQHKLAAPLLYAVMQVESSFNPLAQSQIPAFGLMQIVPDSAGLDVNRLLFNKSTAPEPEQLFKADINISYGAAYLHLLENRYFKQINDPEARLYCMIAAYNTGPGNVARAFNHDGAVSLANAISRINNLSAAQVYQQLLTELPYQETREYLPKVVTAMTLYHNL